MESKIQQYVELYLDEVTLTICVTDELKRQKGNLEWFGSIRVSNGSVDEKYACFWDNISCFLGINYKGFKKECEEELLLGGFEVKPIFKTIKKLLKRAKKLKIIN